jgi:hypothetical protein
MMIGTAKVGDKTSPQQQSDGPLPPGTRVRSSRSLKSSPGRNLHPWSIDDRVPFESALSHEWNAIHDEMRPTENQRILDNARSSPRDQEKYDLLDANWTATAN